jgi:NAD-dependent dihydropyrimidine dehydrogenase PreA subunit/coenzyme F420-reducing hydrogenase delta subunit
MDAVANRLYGWRYNPLYQTGALTVFLLAIVIVTGVYLFLFYRIGDPYGSVVRINDQAWAGRWIRGLHRYASDAALVAAGLHALRMFAQGRSWGRRALAWVSGVVLVALVLICGWTGFVMVWDVQGLVLAAEGARLLDALPIFADPVSRAFVGAAPMPSAFFFINLFLHVALPVGLGIVLWVHVSRVARPTVMPPPGVAITTGIVLLALSILWPASIGGPADLLRMPGEVPLDLFYAFWLPILRAFPPWGGAALFAALFLVLASVPLWTRLPREKRPPPSVVDERLCTGCVQCSLDCPYEAIAMIERTDGRAELVARVDPTRCVSCGICSGSCAPMGVGPGGRTGRDQLARLRAWLGGVESLADVVIVGCDRTAAGRWVGSAFHDAPVFAVSCSGNAHSSTVEQLLRAGARGVLVVSCPPRDCWNREGPKWTEARLFHDREAELHRRVDKRCVRLVFASAREDARLRAELAAFRKDLEVLERIDSLLDLGVEHECEPAEPTEVVRR